MHFSTHLATVRVALLRSSWRSCFMRAALFTIRATNSSLVFTFSLYTSIFIHPQRQKSDLYTPNSNSCIFTTIENWTNVYVNLLTRNSPYYHLLKYLLFLLKHPVHTHTHTNKHTHSSIIGNGLLKNSYFPLWEFIFSKTDSNCNKICKFKNWKSLIEIRQYWSQILCVLLKQCPIAAALGRTR